MLLGGLTEYKIQRLHPANVLKLSNQLAGEGSQPSYIGFHLSYILLGRGGGWFPVSGFYVVVGVFFKRRYYKLHYDNNYYNNSNMV